MPIITIFSGAYCREDQVVSRLLEKTGYRHLSDTNIVSRAKKASDLPDNKIERAFSAKTSVFNQFTHEKERAIAYLKLVMSEMLREDNLLIQGLVSLLVPKEISHALQICLIADMKNRVAAAQQDSVLSTQEALKLIHRKDEDCAAWVAALFGRKDPWDPSLFDMVIPTDKLSPEEILALVEKNLAKDILQAGAASRLAVDDFSLAAQVEVALAKEGHQVKVEARGGEITLTINKHVLMLSRLEEELKSIAVRIPGVTSVETKVGQEFHQADIYRKFDFDIPSKVLLVDDEREFVQTLSERLLLREMGSAVAYDGETALSMVREDEPEVMILDLKMPGIDGMEVLKRVKQTHPLIEVIILTGHGSEADKETCLGLGAFAYLQKPVDVDLLSETIKRANEKIQGQR
jgi:two-component system response regulator CpxR